MAGFGSGAGKGPLPRHVDKDKTDATNERVFGVKEPWWVKRDREKAETPNKKGEK